MSGFDLFVIIKKSTRGRFLYPSIVRNRFPKEGRTSGEHDAYAVARWLSETATRGALDRYFRPPLAIEERRVAELEGWILGVG